MFFSVIMTPGTFVAPGLSAVTPKSIAMPPSVSAAYASVARPTINANSFGFSVVKLASVDMNLMAGVYSFDRSIPWADN